MSTPAPSHLLAAERSALARAYHERTKHRVARYAPGPETLDWEAMPAAFRHFDGAPVIELPLLSQLESDDALRRSVSRVWPLDAARPAPVQLSRASLGALLELSMGITAWKTLGPDRWAVRANPSSGNLHPVEAYVLALSVPGIEAGVWHYRPDQHALEQRASWVAQPPGTANQRVFVALTTLIWREAWKYGERAFRYCQLDVGHAVAALSYAAALLGWRVSECSNISARRLAGLLGIDRSEDFGGSGCANTEREEPEIVLALEPADTAPSHAACLPLTAAEIGASYAGVASRIDRRPLYRWPILDEIAAVTRESARAQAAPNAALPTARRPAERSAVSALSVLMQRRSAQRFDAHYSTPRATFFELLAALSPTAHAPWHAVGATVLMYAASSGKVALVAQLLEAGADPHVRNQDGAKAVDMCASFGCLSLLRHTAE